MNMLGHSALFVVLALAGCAGQPDTRSADEAAIHALVRDWSASARAKNAARFTSVYADGAVVMLEDAPDLRGLEAIRAGIGGMMQDPNFALSFQADKVVVARSGDLAYETGTYSLTLSGPDQEPSKEAGNYVVVWRKQADGDWKVVIDAPISDPLEPPAASDAR